jgi:hypothetical protein
MSSKICKAILDLRPDDWEGTYNQGNTFLTHLYVENVIYATPIIAKDDFTKMVEDAGKAITDANKGDDTEKAIREDLCRELHYAMGKKLIPYINGLWIGNLTNLEKSGAKVSADSSPVPPPDQPVINRIGRGPIAGSVKISLVRGVNSTLKRRSRTLYRVFMFEKEDDVKGTEVGSTYNSNKLYGYEVPESVNRYFSVQAQNSGGYSLLASKVKYYLLT